MGKCRRCACRHASGAPSAQPSRLGYVRRPSGEVALVPDEQVQGVVRLMFRLFEQLGTVHTVLRFLAGHEVQIGIRERSRPGKGRGRLAGAAPDRPGQYAAQPGVCRDLRLRAQPHRPVPAAAWLRALRPGAVWMPGSGWCASTGALPAYISVEQCEAPEAMRGPGFSMHRPARMRPPAAATTRPRYQCSTLPPAHRTARQPGLGDRQRI